VLAHQPLLVTSAPPIGPTFVPTYDICPELFAPLDIFPHPPEITTADLRPPVPHEKKSEDPNPEKGKGSPYSITERRVPELMPDLGSQPAGDVSHKPGGRLPLLAARPTVTLATLKRAATNFAGW